eukprot:4733044-Alexandrium_andersonii.AAC.1
MRKGPRKVRLVDSETVIPADGLGVRSRRGGQRARPGVCSYMERGRGLAGLAACASVYASSVRLRVAAACRGTHGVRRAVT